MSLVSVLVPTFRRPESLSRAVRSLFAQEGAPPFETVVIDNDPAGSAQGVLKELASLSPAPFHYAHEPRPGVSFARNAAVRLASGDRFAFLDDDQEAPPIWLHALCDVQYSTKADAVFGPVEAIVDGAEGPLAEVAAALYRREGPTVAGVIERYYGIGNALVRRDLFGAEPFDPSANEKGGEDDLLFSRAQKNGARFAWAPEASVIEHVEPERARLRAVLKRSFAYGQGPCETAAARRDALSIARHMLVGAGQTAIYGAAAGVACVAGNSGRYALLERAARGAGKLFWFAPQRFYGAAALRRAPVANKLSSQATAGSASV